MRFNKFLVFSLIILLTLSCTAKKDILYLQNINENEVYSNEYSEYVLKEGDILKIDVSSENPETAIIYSPNGVNSSIFNTRDALLFNGYMIDSEGYINFPTTGKIFAKGLTIIELHRNLSKKIIESQILTKPTIDIKLLNSHFTILGEINRPGRYDYLKNNLSVLEAIGMAGDLTINGVRQDIKLIRDNSGKKTVYSLDLTKASLLTDNSFQIISGDIIIINPNSTRVKNAGVIGNAGTLLSLLSFLLSSIILITNN